MNEKESAKCNENRRKRKFESKILITNCNKILFVDIPMQQMLLQCSLLHMHNTTCYNLYIDSEKDMNAF